MLIERIAEPAEEPLTLTEAKLHLRVTGTADDAYITALIVAARMAAEQELGRCLIETTLALKLDAFPVGDIELPWGTVTSIEEFTYLDADGDEVTLATDDYQWDANGRLSPAPNATWPSTETGRNNAVTVEYKAGWTDADEVPENIKAWMKLQIGALYDSRSAAVIGAAATELPGARALLDRWRWGAA